MEILFFACIAAFILFRLYNILGKSDGGGTNYKFNEKLNENINGIVSACIKDVTNSAEPVAIASEHSRKNPKIFSSLNEIHELDQSFREETFLNGAKKAFELVIKSFCTGNKETLKILLSKEICRDFINEIEQNQVNKRLIEKVLTSIQSVEIIDVLLEKAVATIKVKFVTEQINIVRNLDNVIIEGNPSKAQLIEDVWSFSRNVKASSPNWQVVNITS
jgi:predicted lipid-binding transport protein (Tim44 family)